MSDAALELEGIEKRFGGVLALEGAAVRVRAGSVHAVLGENGAGKSTLMRVAFGLVRPDRGVVRIGGRERRLQSSAEAIGAGLGMVHQHFSLVPAMTVAENVALGGRGRYGAARAAEVVRRVGEETGLTLDPRARIADLGVGAQQRVEIVKALSRDAQVLILDEPTAVLAPQETLDLLAWLRRFAESGRSAVVITHKLREVLAVADEVTVLRRGRTVLSTPRTGLTEDALAHAMLGAPPQQQDARELGVHQNHDAAPPVELTPAPRGEVVLRAAGVTLADEGGTRRVRGATFVVRGGEIVGVVGVEGSGQRELLRALAGRLAPLAGSVTLPDEVGFVPEDRHRDALLLDFPLSENVALRGAGPRHGRIDWRSWAQATTRLLGAFDVRAAGAATPARTLSGGNQQKLVLGREVQGGVRALVVENPSRGLDVRAAADVHRRLREARDGGAAVLVYCSDIDEVLLLADRVLVVHDGRVRETSRERETVGRAMLGTL